VIVDAHLDIAWNAVAEGRGFDSALPRGYMVNRDSVTGAGVGLVFATIFTFPAAARGDSAPLRYQTPGEAHIMGRAQVGYYQSLGLRLLRTQRDIKAYRRGWRPGMLAAVLLMENADPIESPAQLPVWAGLGVRVIGPAWSRTRYCGGTHAPGGLTDLGYGLLRAMAKAHLILDLSHMADRSMRDALDVWRGPVVVTHVGSRVLNPGQRQLPDKIAAEVAERGGMVGISFYSGHLKARGKAGVADIVRHAVHFARVTGDPRFVGIGSDLDGGFDARKAAVPRVSAMAQVERALARQFGPGGAAGIMGGNWLDFLERSLPAR